MKFTTIASLFTLSGLTSAVPFQAHGATPDASPAASSVTLNDISKGAALATRQDRCPATETGISVWKISDFTGRKPQGTYWGMVTFKAQWISNNNLNDVTCENDNLFGVADHQWVPCSEGSSIYFAVDSGSNSFWIRDGPDDTSPQGATTLPFNCRVGGDGPTDQVCTSVADRCITLVARPTR